MNSLLKKIYSILFLVLFLSLNVSLADNPVIPDIGMSDPHMRVFHDTLYLYCGHDTHPNDQTWVMQEWRVFRSTDLVNWTLEHSISPQDNYMDDNSTDCWAADAAQRNGKSFFYFSDRKRGIGVMQADHPTGPFSDALGKPLVSPMHDPTILIDDDVNQTPYIIYGDKAGGGFHIAELNDDMISVAHEPLPIEIKGKEWEEAPQWMDKNYIFKHNGVYYLSWGRDYAVSKNIYGPYECVGAVGNGHQLSEFAHGSFFWWKGQFYHIWCYYLRLGFKYRESIITYCHFDDAGHIVTDTGFLDKHFATGVGQYDAEWSKIEAEWFYEKSHGLQKHSTHDGFEMTDFKDGSWLLFTNVNFSQDITKFSARVACSKNGRLEVRADAPNGKLLGTLFLTSTESEYQTLSSNVKIISGKHDVYIKYIGTDNNHFSLDWIHFSSFKN